MIKIGHNDRGEAAVLLTLGTALFYALRSRNLDKRLFG
jgi:hypothetical protein